MFPVFQLAVYKKRHVHRPICNILPYKQLLHLRLNVASLEAGWYLKARLKRACIPYLISLFQFYPPAKPINMKHSFPSRNNTNIGIVRVHLVWVSQY
jgi:hypothetical protein